MSKCFIACCQGYLKQHLTVCAKYEKPHDTLVMNSELAGAGKEAAPNHF
jgi:hypothetical protein